MFGICAQLLDPGGVVDGLGVGVAAVGGDEGDPGAVCAGWVLGEVVLDGGVGAAGGASGVEAVGGGEGAAGFGGACFGDDLDVVDECLGAQWGDDAGADAGDASFLGGPPKMTEPSASTAMMWQWG